MEQSEAPKERRQPGRPRKWASEAERVRAYRQRKATEQADVDSLRVERRLLKRQLADAVLARERAEAALDRQRKRVDRLERELDRAQQRLERSEFELNSLRSRNEQLLTDHGLRQRVTSSR